MQRERRYPKRRRQSETDTSQHGDHYREAERTGVNSNLIEKRNVDCIQMGQQTGRPNGEQQTQERAAAGKYKA